MLWFFQESCMGMRFGLKKAEHQRIDAFEWCCWQRLLRIPWTARRSNQSTLKEISPWYSWKNWCWSWNSNTSATWCEELTHWKRPWCWERLRAGGEGANRGWGFSMASPTQLTWVWVNSGNWWWTQRPSVLPFMGLQKVGHNWATDLNWKPKHHSTGDAVSTHWLVRFPGLRNATHSSNPVWRIPWTEEPGGLESMGL